MSKHNCIHYNICRTTIVIPFIFAIIVVSKKVYSKIYLKQIVENFIYILFFLSYLTPSIHQCFFEKPTLKTILSHTINESIIITFIMNMHMSIEFEEISMSHQISFYSCLLFNRMQLCAYLYCYNDIIIVKVNIFMTIHLKFDTLESLTNDQS